LETSKCSNNDSGLVCFVGNWIGQRKAGRSIEIEMEINNVDRKVDHVDGVKRNANGGEEKGLLVDTEEDNNLMANAAARKMRVDHFPRSDVSIAFALNELDSILEAEDEVSSFPLEEEQGVEAASLFDRGGPGELLVAGQESPAKLESHPLDFALQFPVMCIVTTASLPWLTGTAVNPALRAAYLWNLGIHCILLVPWVPNEDQKMIFAPGIYFDDPRQQLKAIQESIQHRVPFDLPEIKMMTQTETRRRLRKRRRTVDCIEEHKVSKDHTGTPEFCIGFYRGKYAPALGSIIPAEDIQALVPRNVSCIVLEEPEHLTWYHSGCRWIRAFEKYVPVIGVMHTNYVDYARRMAGETASLTLKRLNKFLCRQHTHRVIKLSDAVQKLPREETCFVHGVSEKFLDVGRQICSTDWKFSKGAYFLGKALWAKGFEELLERMSEYATACQKAREELVTIDVYGHGKELNDIMKASIERELPIQFLGPKDHLSKEMAEYRVFVNPSTSDVVATTSAEALAMGKWLLVPKHPCNQFFEENFRNCLVYNSATEFSELILRATTSDPYKLSKEEMFSLSWECATQRFLHCCSGADLERSKRLSFERVACKTSWFGYNVGYNVYSIVSKAMDSVLKAIQHSADAKKIKSHAL